MLPNVKVLIGKPIFFNTLNNNKMNQKQKDRLRKWFESLERSNQIDIALECIEELIDANFIYFPSTTISPIWKESQEDLDRIY